MARIPERGRPFKVRKHSSRPSQGAVSKSVTQERVDQTLKITVRQAQRLKALPDSLHKLACINRLFVFCNSHGDEFKQAFQEHLSTDFKRLRARWALWGVRNGSDLLADQIAKNGGGA